MEVGQGVAFKVGVVVETRGRGNLQGECLAVASCPSKQIIAEETNHIAESSVSDERCQVDGGVTYCRVVEVNNAHKLRSREDQVVQSEIAMYEAGWGWHQSENVLHKFVRQGLKRRRKHGDAFVDKLPPAISSTPGTDTTEILRQLSDIDVGECCQDGDHQVARLRLRESLPRLS